MGEERNRNSEHTDENAQPTERWVGSEAFGSYVSDNALMPSTIGSYRILSVLGRGGMGVVYEAEQQTPRRAVALKVIRGERYVDAPYLRLFQREAQTLARLRHSGIASIYESGCTDDGHHFFAMELVRGEPLHLFVQKNSLERLGRLGLFRQVCEAINYAHQRGVIHRDLKPGNIMVTDDGKPKVLDFGLARITDTDVAAATLVTEVGRIQGTLSYMSPEQSRGNTDEIDLRSDVYSLGVVLYQLLTNRLPHDFTHSALHDAVRTLCDVPPVRPGHLDHSLRGDLETIVLKALAKQPSERYQSAAALADDIERFERNQPILARPPSPLYVFRKLVSRHKVGASFVMVLLVTVASVALWMSVLYHEASVLRIEAEEATAVARTEAESQNRISDFLVDLFDVSDPNVAQGRLPTARDLLDRGSKTIQKKVKEPLVAAELMETMARAYRNLCDYETAVALQEEVLRIRREALPKEHPLVTDSVLSLGWALKQKGDLVQAEERLEEARSSYIEHGNDAGKRKALRLLGATFRDDGRYDKAVEFLKTALTQCEALDGDHPLEVSESMESLATALLALGDLEESEQLLLRAIELRRSARGEDYSTIASGWDRLAFVLQRQGRYKEAEDVLRRAIRIREKTHGENHAYRASESGQLGAIFRDRGDLDGAEATLRDALSRCAKNTATNPVWPAGVQVDLAYVLIAKRQYAQAEQSLQKANAVLKERYRPNHPRLAGPLLAMALLALELGDHQAAIRHAEEAHSLLVGALPANHWSVGFSENLLGAARANTNCTEEAISLARQGFETMKVVRGPSDVHVRRAEARLAGIQALCADRAP